MDAMLAYCGLPCSDCPAYVATQADDLAALQRVLERWSAEFNAPHIGIEDMLCDGCKPQGGRLNGYCRVCKIRACAAARRLDSCAECDEYACANLEHMLERCDDLPEYWAYVRPARANLKRIHAALAHSTATN